MLFVSGSIAYDTIISSVGTFASNVRGIDSPYNLSLYAPRVRVASGGTGHNIAYNLGLLGLKEQTVLAGSVGHDFTHDPRLAACVDYRHVLVDDTALTAHAYMINDDDKTQIIAFHPGAMASWLQTIPDHPYRYAIITPNDKAIMIAHTHAARQTWAVVFFDPGQALWLFNKDDLVWLVPSIDYLICNEPESESIALLFGVSVDQLSTIFANVIVTRGWDGIDFRPSSGEKYHIPSVMVDAVVDPTGAGDACRGGMLYALMQWKSIEQALQYGSVMGACAVQQQGTMEHSITVDELEEGVK